MAALGLPYSTYVGLEAEATSISDYGLVMTWAYPAYRSNSQSGKLLTEKLDIQGIFLSGIAMQAANPGSSSSSLSDRQPDKIAMGEGNQRGHGGADCSKQSHHAPGHPDLSRRGS